MISLDVLRAAIEERKRQANAVFVQYASGMWRYALVAPKRDAMVSDLGAEMLSFAHHYEPTVQVVEFLEANSPAAVLCQCEAEIEIIELYKTATETPPSAFSSFMRGQDDGFRQALEEVLRRLAHAYAIPTEDGTP